MPDEISQSFSFSHVPQAVACNEKMVTDWETHWSTWIVNLLEGILVYLKGWEKTLVRSFLTVGRSCPHK